MTLAIIGLITAIGASLGRKGLYDQPDGSKPRRRSSPAAPLDTSAGGYGVTGDGGGGGSCEGGGGGSC
jgi:hypothetical protein